MNLLLKRIKEAIGKDIDMREKLAERRNLQQRIDGLTPREQEVLSLIINSLFQQRVSKNAGYQSSYHRGTPLPHHEKNAGGQCYRVGGDAQGFVTVQKRQRAKGEGRRKKEEGRRKKEEAKKEEG